MISKNDFADIYEEFFPKLYSYIFHRINDCKISEDLVSQVFFKALRNLDKYDESKWQISTWLYTITSNTLIDYYRKDEQYESIEEYENTLIHTDNNRQDIDIEFNISKVAEVLKKLPTRSQEIITLRIFQELSFVEIAKIVWIWESGVKMSFARSIEVIKNSVNLLILFIFLLIG